MKKKILYISLGDGSDMRANKEINTMQKIADIYFLGVGEYSELNYAKKKCKDLLLVQGKKNTIRVNFQLVYEYIKWNRKYKFDNLHIVNEQLMIFFYPLIFRKYVVLDLYDSIFLKLNKPYNKWYIIKKIIYKPIDFIFVTDENRREMMPGFVGKRLGVLENYPYTYHGSIKKKTKKLTIFYNGSMSNARGTSVLQNLIYNFKDIEIIMAGWINDDVTKLFSKNVNVDYRGVINQKEANRIAAEESDYIMCCYEPSNTNNINASPNKIYDAIQTHTPVIINKEVKVSIFVEDKQIGVILSSFYDYNVDEVYEELINKRGKFNFEDIDKRKYSWEGIENKLLEAHKLNKKL